MSAINSAHSVFCCVMSAISYSGLGGAGAGETGAAGAGEDSDGSATGTSAGLEGAASVGCFASEL